MITNLFDVQLDRSLKNHVITNII